jgi:hypothetical protein
MSFALQLCQGCRGLRAIGEDRAGVGFTLVVSAAGVIGGLAAALASHGATLSAFGAWPAAAWAQIVPLSLMAAGTAMALEHVAMAHGERSRELCAWLGYHDAIGEKMSTLAGPQAWALVFYSHEFASRFWSANPPPGTDERPAAPELPSA